MRSRFFPMLLVGFVALASMARSVQAFSVAPASIELSGGRGQTVGGVAHLINESAAERTVYLSAIKATTREDGTSPKFFSPEEDHSGIPEWISFPSSVLLPPNTNTNVAFSVAIPSDVPSGGYYGALVVSDAPAPVVSTNGAVLQADIAILLLLTVEGETHAVAPLLDFVREGSGVVPSVGEIAYTWRAQNQGNVHVAPEGVVRVTDLFGRSVLEADANPDRGRILPGATRSFNGVLQPVRSGFLDRAREEVQFFGMGPVTVTLDATAGESVLARSFTVWVFPWHALLIVLLTCLVLLGLFRLVLRKAPPSS